jgi:hypothetical protein
VRLSEIFLSLPVAAAGEKRQNLLKLEVLAALAGRRARKGETLVMPTVMFIVGCIAIMAGAVMIAFGIPINEFSFGNTLIVAGTTLATGGLVVVGLSTVARQLDRLAEGQGSRVPAQPGREAEAFETPTDARAAAARIPFPGRPAREPLPPEATMPPPLAAAPASEERPGQSFAPSFAPALRNPEAPPVTVEDEVSLSPQYQPASSEVAPPARPKLPGAAPSAPGPESRRAEPPAPTREAPTSYFDSMWPAKPRTAPAPEAPRPPRPEAAPRERESIARAPAPESRPAAARAVAILKSGVVDGMAYTLYVDGSIEAELPQGTLRFASIDELRSHLEKNS